MAYDAIINVRIHKFNVTVEKTAGGKYRWRGQTSADTLDELEQNLEGIKTRVEKKIEGWVK
jgi:hypothetical protein